MPLQYTETLNGLYNSTFQLRKKDIENQIFTATPFWYLISEKGHRQTQEGGTRIEQPIVYAKNETVQYFGRGGTVSIGDTDPITNAYYEWKYMAGSIVRYFTDDQKNRGKTAVFKLMKAKITNLIDSMVDQYETSLFSDGTADAGLEIDGLSNLIATNPTTGTVGGINRANYSFWRNNFKNMSGEAASTYLVKRMKTMFNDCGKYGKGTKRYPNLILCAQDAYELFEDEVAEIQRINDTTGIGALGFDMLKYKGIPMTWSPSCPDTYMYFLNMNFIYFMADPIANFDLTDWKPIIDQPNDVVAQAVNVGNLTASAMNRHGVIWNIAE